MTNKAKTKQNAVIRCDLCEHRYEVKYNTPHGLDSYFYCRKSSKKAPLGFLLTKDNDSCDNFKQRENNGEEI